MADSSVLYRYPSLHLAIFIMIGCAVAAAFLLLSFMSLLLLVVCAVVTFLIATTLCYHSSGEFWREKFSQLLVLSLAAYSSMTRNNGERRYTITDKGPVPTLIHFECQKIVQLIVRDFIVSWYSVVTKDKELPRDVVKLLQHLALDLYFRLQNVDLKDLILHVLPVINPFLSTLNEVGYASTNNGRLTTYDVNHPYCVILFEKNPHLTHPSLKSSVAEIQYLQKLVDSYLLSSVPSQYLKCDIALQLIRNVLVYRLLKPVFDLLCDPIFLTESIPLILSKLPEKIVQEVLSNIERENNQLEIELSTEDGLLTSVLEYHSAIFGSLSTGVLEQRDLGMENEVQSEIGEGVQLIQSVSAPSEEIVFVTLPSIYISRHVCVDTKEGIHIGYIIKFPRSLMDQEWLVRLALGTDSTELESLKRYSEFVKFHKQLSKSQMSFLVRGIPLPDKRVMSSLWSKVSSSDLDPASIIERREGLDKYIQQISDIPKIRDSDLFREFLESGVSVLEDAHIVSKTAKQPRKRSHIDSKKVSCFEDSHDIERVLDVFLGMQVLIPCPDLLSSNHETVRKGSSLSPSQHYSASHTSAIAVTATDCLRQRPVSTLSDYFFTDYSKDEKLLLQCQEKAPLFNQLMSLANDATSTTVSELWITNTTTQLALINILGKPIDDFLWKELLDVVSDDTMWARVLYNLRHTLWPKGRLREAGRHYVLTESEKRQLRNNAVTEIKAFLPDLIPLFIGSENYKNTIHHCLDSIQNPRINRHLLYHLVDLLFDRVVPEFSDSSFQQHVLTLRSKPLFVSK